MVGEEFSDAVRARYSILIVSDAVGGGLLLEPFDAVPVRGWLDSRHLMPFDVLDATRRRWLWSDELADEFVQVLLCLSAIPAPAALAGEPATTFACNSAGSMRLLRAKPAGKLIGISLRPLITSGFASCTLPELIDDTLSDAIDAFSCNFLLLAAPSTTCCPRSS